MPTMTMRVIYPAARVVTTSTPTPLTFRRKAITTTWSMIAAVRNKKKTIKKNIGKWLEPLMGPPGGPPHEDEEAARLFKMHVKNGVAPDEVLSSAEEVVALVAPIPMREGMRESLLRMTAAMVPHIEELDEDRSDIVFPDGFHGAPKKACL